MSTIVVTPPAAAERVDQMKSSWSFWLSEWVCASVAPGRMRAAPRSCRSRAAVAADLVACNRHPAAFNDAVRADDGANEDGIEIGHGMLARNGVSTMPRCA